jgi:dihydrofolate reductase
MRLTMTMFLSMDGIYQGPGGPEEDTRGGFTQGGWVVPYFDDDAGQLVTRWFAAADAFLLGRRTYEIFAGAWPTVTDPADPVAAKLNRQPKYVVSNTLASAGWEPTTVLKGDPVEQVAKLKEQPGDELQIHGSGRLAQTLMAYGLIDEYRLWVFPVVLGAGYRLFADGCPPAALKLVETRTTGSGVVVHVYQPAGAPTYGTVVLDEGGVSFDR